MRKSMLGAALALASLLGAASAQDFPTRPMTMVIPFAAGGPTDVLGRVIAARMGEVLGQNVIIENVGGAGGMTGSSKVAQARPDGYTMALGTVGTHAQGQTLYKKPLYNAATDFTPVALIAEVPIVLIARKDLPVNDLKEFVDYAKKNQDKMQFGSAGAGSATHLGCVVLNSAMGANITHVPYRGTGPAMQDLISGQIQVMVDQSSNSLPQVQAGKIRAYAQTAAKRSPAMPDIPTAAEAGYPMEVSIWNGLWAPKGTPKDIVDRLNAAAITALADPAVRKRMEELGQDLPTPEEMKPAAFAAFQKAELARWKPILEAAGVKAE